ncbi:MAG: RDD family protein [Flammeovirgaceae bacterium]
MSIISVDTTQNVSIQYELASAGDRVTAYIIDMLIKIAYIIFLVFSFSFFSFQVSNSLIVILSLPLLFYDLILEYFRDGQTIGKQKMKIKVIAVTGRQASVSSYILRWMFRPVDFVLFSPAIALATILIVGKGQRIGDIAAGTCVVNIARPRRQLYALPKFEENYLPTFWEVQQLEDKDIHLIERILTTYGKQQDKQQAIRLTAEKVKKVLNIQTELPDYTFLKTIIMDYYHITSGSILL